MENSFLICIWNGCSQFGDLIAVFLGYVIVQWGGASHGYLILAIGVLLLLILIVNSIFLVPSPKQELSNNIESGNQVEMQ